MGVGFMLTMYTTIVRQSTCLFTYSVYLHASVIIFLSIHLKRKDGAENNHDRLRVLNASGGILALRWLFEIGAAPLFGRLIDKVGQAIVCPTFSIMWRACSEKQYISRGA